ncbi:MAG: CopG family ribbon-helix-helix protein [Promethearchaeota archaeon]
MKTITIKLPPQEAARLDAFIQEKKYPSKSEFIRNLIRQKLDEETQQKERMGWLSLAEQSLQDLWNNEKDEETWKEYL